jgi:hypothetical protein
MPSSLPLVPGHKLEWSDSSPVDWQKLDAIYTKATQQPASASVGADANSTIDAFCDET